MPHYNVWTKHGEIGVIMEDIKEEEDDDNYVPLNTVMLQRGELLKIKRNQMMCPMMISAASLLMQGDSAKVKRRS